MEKGEPSYIVSGNVNWYSHYGEQYRGFPENQKQLPCNPAILLLGIYLEKTVIQKDTGHPPCLLQHCLHSQGTEAT